MGVGCLCGLCVCGLRVWFVVGVWVGGGWKVGWLVGGCACVSVDFELCPWLIVMCGRHSQAESVAGAAHLPLDYAGDLR